ncbi:MAG: hypothetical protein ACR5KW_02860 [Wolbachia sp.]
MDKQFYICMALNGQLNMLAILNVKLENIPKFYSTILFKHCSVDRVIGMLLYRLHSYVDRSKLLFDVQVEEFNNFHSKNS